MDATDRRILGVLVSEGRVTFSELAARIGLSGPSTAERVRRLESDGVIAGYSAILNPVRAEAELAAFISVTLGSTDATEPFLAAMQREPMVLELHHVAGDGDYVLKVRCANTRELEQLISGVIKGVAGVSATRTTVVLSSRFERPVRARSDV